MNFNQIESNTQNEKSQFATSKQTNKNLTEYLGWQCNTFKLRFVSFRLCFAEHFIALSPILITTEYNTGSMVIQYQTEKTRERERTKNGAAKTV